MTRSAYLLQTLTFSLLAAVASAQDGAEPLAAPVPVVADPSMVSVPGQGLAKVDSPWHFEVSVYALVAGMSGNVMIDGRSANFDYSASDLLQHLKFGAMGTARVGYDKWALTEDVMYLDLGAAKRNFTVDVHQTMIETDARYRVCPYFEALVGARYNNVNLDLHIPTGTAFTHTIQWWDPLIGGEGTLPLSKRWALKVRGDVGGFGVGSRVSWQFFPSINWQFINWASLQAGYRLIDTDYHKGSGLNEQAYDVLVQGVQIGLAATF